MAHRLELSLKDALNNTPLKDIDEMLMGVYYVYKKSSKKCRELEGVIQKLKACLEGEIPHKRGHRPFCFVAHALLLTK